MKIEFKKYRNVDVVMNQSIGTTIIHGGEFFVMTDFDEDNKNSVACVGIGSDNIGETQMIPNDAEVEIINFKLVEV